MVWISSLFFAILRFVDSSVDLIFCALCYEFKLSNLGAKTGRREGDL